MDDFQFSRPKTLHAQAKTHGTPEKRNGKTKQVLILVQRAVGQEEWTSRLAEDLQEGCDQADAIRG
jgi:hypothetical protein